MDISTNDAIDDIRWRVRDNIPPEARQSLAKKLKELEQMQPDEEVKTASCKVDKEGEQMQNPEEQPVAK